MCAVEDLNRSLDKAENDGETKALRESLRSRTRPHPNPASTWTRSSSTTHAAATLRRELVGLEV